MSGLPKKDAPAAPDPAAHGSPLVEVLGLLFTREQIEKLLVDGFAVALERKMQGQTFEALTETMQLAADLRLFKEGLFLTGEQVARMLQISERTFSDYKRDKKIAVDAHIGPGSLRFSLFDVLRCRAELLQEAAAATAAGPTVTITPVATRTRRKAATRG